MKELVQFLLIVIFGALFLTTSAAKCVPGAVPASYVNFTSDYQLTWPAASNPENCTITEYLIYLTNIDDSTVQLYETKAYDNNIYDFSTLEMCTNYKFEIIAKTNEDYIGAFATVTLVTSAKSDINLNLTLNSTVNRQNSINVSWAMDESNATKCVSYYRLVIWNETNNPIDMYLNHTNYTLTNTIPCATYEFQVRAILINPEIEGPFSIVKNQSMSNSTTPPKLNSIFTTATTVHMSWQLEAYEKNKCQIKSLVINTLPNVTVITNVIDSPSRGLVDVILTGLQPDTVYTSSVYVVNSAGNSTAIVVTYQTDDVDDGSNFIKKYWKKMLGYL